ncbi:MAG: site-2 protease family protein [Candidatus Pacebacteria bacterium]|nr:site-2 protease family protein [Candidatus Paceibacterota bacterium]
MTFIIFILILVALILVHEFGHFIVAKLSKIKVEEFGIFFPPRLFAIKKGETEYSFNWLPFGGFVRIFGENHNENASDPRSFASKPRYTQAAVVVAGIVMNILFAWLVLSLGYMVGLPSAADRADAGQVSDVKTMITAVLPDSPAAKAGILAEDVVKTVGTGMIAPQTFETADDVQSFIAAHGEESIILTVLRDDEEKTFIARPVEGFVEGRKALGVQLGDVGVLKLPVHLALVQGAKLTYEMTVGTAQGLASFFVQIARGVADFTTVAGPIGIVNIGAGAVTDGFAAAVVLTAVISINLAIINLLPIPGLDGGRLLIIAVESVLRRPVSKKITMALTLAGFGLLITLMLVVSYHDIVRLVG